MTGWASAEPVVRLSAFVGVLAIVAALEAVAPRRRPGTSRWRRWPGNIGILAIDTVLVRLLFPLAAIGVAVIAGDRGWGLLHQLALPGWLTITLAVIALDLVIYAQHVGFHAVPWLWRVHRLHHADTELDVTTALRFHPAEIIVSLLIKWAAIVAIGAPPLAVLIFEILLNAAAMINHGNIALPAGLDRWLRLVMVTPDMHRVHHSVAADERNRNFGFSLPWWDRLFGTYRAQPAAGHAAMTIGLAQFRAPGDQRIDRMLLQPLRRAEANRGEE
ncbi:MAG: sterol desaturase [Sphingomonas sp. 28-66-16]|nr:MAG: sterol desaturase [Sphingomonas sp. 28-66-16]